jgi:hypothetical protein
MLADQRGPQARATRPCHDFSRAGTAPDDLGVIDSAVTRVTERVLSQVLAAWAVR